MPFRGAIFFDGVTSLRCSLVIKTSPLVDDPERTISAKRSFGEPVWRNGHSFEDSESVLACHLSPFWDRWLGTQTTQISHSDLNVGWEADVAARKSRLAFLEGVAECLVVETPVAVEMLIRWCSTQ